MRKNFKGTASELAGKITLNGKVLTKPMLSQLYTYGLLGSLAGKIAPESGKGKHIHIFDLKSGNVKIEFGEAVVVPAPVATDNATATADATGEGEATGEADATESNETVGGEADGEEVVAQSDDDAPQDTLAEAA